MGAHIYAKATFIIFIIVTTVLASIFLSFFIVKPVVLILPDTSLINNSSLSAANFTGFRSHTLEDNLMRKCWTCACCYIVIGSRGAFYGLLSNIGLAEHLLGSFFKKKEDWTKTGFHLQ